MPETKDRKAISAFIPKEVHKKLRLLCIVSELNQGEIIGKAIERYVNQQLEESRKKKAESLKD